MDSQSEEFTISKLQQPAGIIILFSNNAYLVKNKYYNYYKKRNFNWFY